jgi:hypothetical protein
LNPKWFGDSYDIVKKFFVNVLKDIGYEVYIEPMFTGDWNGGEQKFINFIVAEPVEDIILPAQKSALFIDPDTGIGKKATSKHVTIDSLIRKLEKYEILLVFDQSFSRSKSSEEQMKKKLSTLNKLGGNGFYYDSHTKFLFASKNLNAINTIRKKLLQIGIPSTRLITKKDI